MSTDDDETSEPAKPGPDKSAQGFPVESIAETGVSRHLVNPRAAAGRLSIALASGIAGTLLTSGFLPFRIRAVVGWDVASAVYLAIAWTMIFRATPHATRLRAGNNDPGRHLVFAIALGSSLFSLFAAIIVLRQLKSLPPEQVAIWTGLALAAVALSWLTTHTAFTLRYAHLYYRQHHVPSVNSQGCLQFPGTKMPADMDFAYFAFTVGMCFQVSDVVVATSRARRSVLLHALVSFVYNTTILALSLNLVTTILS